MVQSPFLYLEPIDLNLKPFRVVLQLLGVDLQLMGDLEVTSGHLRNIGGFTGDLCHDRSLLLHGLGQVECSLGDDSGGVDDLLE